MYLKETAKVNVIAGTRLLIAEANVADVNFKLSIYRFCTSDPLHAVRSYYSTLVISMHLWLIYLGSFNFFKNEYINLPIKFLRKNKRPATEPAQETQKEHAQYQF